MCKFGKGIRSALLLAALILAAPIASGQAPGREKKTKPVPEWDKVYPSDRVLQIHLTVSSQDWDKLPQRPFSYVPARFECGAVRIEKVGVRVKGNSSASTRGERKSFKIDFDRFDRKADFHGLSKINLHNGFKDPTMMREKLAYDLFREAGVPASRVGFAQLYVTVPGRYKRKLLGLYSNVEQVNGAFLKDRFQDPSGTLWKGEGGANLRYLGDDPEPYGGYEIKRNEDRGDFSPLIAFVKALGGIPDSRFKPDIEKVLDVDAFLAYMAVNTLLSNLDSPAGSGHNFYLYHEPTSGRFTLVPWDLNEAFGHFRQGSVRDMETLNIAEPYSGDKILFRRILAVDDYKYRYGDIMVKLMKEGFSPARMNAKIEKLRRLIGKAVKQDRLSPYSFEDFQTSLERDLTGRGRAHMGGAIGLKSFVKNRCASVKAQMARKQIGVKPAGREFRSKPSQDAADTSKPVFAGKYAYQIVPGRQLERTDLDTMATEKGGSLPEGAQGSADDQDVREFLDRFDRNRDGKIGIDEFPGPHEVFSRADRNGDRSLSREEIAGMEKPGSGQEQGGGQLFLAVGDTVVAAIGPNTLYALDAKTLAYLGHNRFGEPEGTHFERRGQAPVAGEPVTICEGDMLWLLAGDLLYRFDLTDLERKKDTELPADPSATPDPGAWLKAHDRDGDRRLSRDEWRASRNPPERFQMNDRNRDGYLDEKELSNLPAMRGETGDGDAPLLEIMGEYLLVKTGGKLLRFDKKKLTFLDELPLEKDRSEHR